MVSHSFTHRFQNITVDPNTGFEGSLIRIELSVIDQADRPSLQNDKYKMYFLVVGEGHGDEEPVIDITSPASGSSQTEDILFVNGTVTSGSENGDVMVEVALEYDTLNLEQDDKYIFKNSHGIGKVGSYDAATGLINWDEDNPEAGGSFSLQLNLSELYDANGSTQTIHIKITEGNGERWTIYQLIDVNLVPRDDDSSGPGDGESGSQSDGNDESSDTSLLLFGGIGALALLIVIIVTLLLVRGRSGETATGVDDAFGGDIAQMDPIEAYVQQLVAQGYPEETARAYAQQYYAQAAQQQQ
jgi:hypothetical protein